MLLLLIIARILCQDKEQCVYNLVCLEEQGE